MNFKSVNKLFPCLFRLVSLLCVLAMFGCSSTMDKAGKSVNEKESQVVGKYANESDPRVYLELKSDGTFIFESGTPKPLNGKYVIDGKLFKISSDAGEHDEYKFEGKTIVTSAGVRYTKQ